MPRSHDLTGKRYGRLTAIQESSISSKKRKWECICDCGNIAHVITSSLVSGRTTSCGCRKLEAARENCKEHGLKPRHGLTNSRVWRIWSGMLYRVNPDSRESEVEKYSGRGITVCERWKIFENFFEDMGHPPEGLSLDRIDVNGNYEPSNCRWATSKEQQNNKRNTRYLIINGEKKPLMMVATELGIKKSAIQYFFSTYKKLLDEYESVSIFTEGS